MENNGAGEARSPGTRNADVQRPDGTPVRVLVVDDEPSLAELLASVLRYEGWYVVTAGSGAEAVRTAREVRRDGDLIDLTATEFELLRFLMRNPRRVLSKAQILDRVWNYDFGGQAHVVELYISYLRKKIDAGRVPLIHTVRGVGYVLKPAG